MNYKMIKVGPFELLDHEGNILDVCDTYLDAYTEACNVLGSKPKRIERVQVGLSVTANFGINPDTNKPIYVRYGLKERRMV